MWVEKSRCLLQRIKIITKRSAWSETPTADEIRKAYRKLARKYHPDLNPGDKAAEERFKKVQEAYDILSDESKKKVYDQYGFYSDNIPPDAGGGGAVRRAVPILTGSILLNICASSSGRPALRQRVFRQLRRKTRAGRFVIPRHLQRDVRRFEARPLRRSRSAAPISSTG